jgi:hypothetical protein
LKATFDPLNGRWLLVLAAVGAPSPPGSRSARLVGFAPTAHFGIIIGTAMLSYTKHGKFLTPTQAARP